jgi:nucleotide-binding universal stress UspA family protein
MDTIILGYDTSEQAERATVRAAELAQALRARLVVVSVAPALAPAVPLTEVGRVEVPIHLAPGPFGTGVPMPVAEGPRVQPEEVAEHQLAQARKSLAGREVDAEYVAEVGDTAERLLAVAEERGADLVVVGHPEHGFLEHLLHRPVDEAVAKRACCDVLLVH